MTIRTPILYINMLSIEVSVTCVGTAIYTEIQVPTKPLSAVSTLRFHFRVFGNNEIMSISITQINMTGSFYTFSKHQCQRITSERRACEDVNEGGG